MGEVRNAQGAVAAAPLQPVAPCQAPVDPLLPSGDALGLAMAENVIKQSWGPTQHSGRCLG